MERTKLLKLAFFGIIIIGIIISLLKDIIRQYVPEWVAWVLLPIVIVVVILFYVVSIKLGRTIRKGGKEAEELRGPVHKTILSIGIYRLVIGFISMIILFYIAYSYLGFKILSPYTLFFLGFLIFTVGFGWFLAIIRKEKYFAPEKGSVFEKEQKKKIISPIILMVVGGILMLMGAFLFL
ncbi:MAG: hypothetical protein ABIE23_06115 [archaeon]